MGNRGDVKKIVFMAVGLALFASNFFMELSDDMSLKWGMGTIILAMTLWWVFEVLPLGITSLLPLVACPLLGLMSTRETASLYMSSTIFIFIGGFFVALAMQKWNLHRRIALNIILFFGNSPARMVLGFMIACWFLSMWISNTATVVMMVSVGLAVIHNFKDMGLDEVKMKNLSVGLMLAIAYSASAGGMATLVGTPPNLVFSRIYSMRFPATEDMSFGGWMLYGFPCSLLILVVIFVVIYMKYLKPLGMRELSSVCVKNELIKMKKITFEEKIVLIVFTLMAFLWMFRKPLSIGQIQIPGWSSLLGHGMMIDDGTIAILCTLLLFFIPSRNHKCILEESDIGKIPWETILLFGGGFAMAKGMDVSGLSDLFKDKVQLLANMPLSIAVTSMVTGMSFFTELSSNTASAQIFLPIVASLADELNMNPLVFMVPVTLAASCAFMLPAATAPNAIVFGSRVVSVSHMIKTGFLVHCIAVILVSAWSLLVI